jgi:hypothetical protein
MGDTCQITFAELNCKPGENKLTGFNCIFFWNLPGDTAGENRQLEKLS